MEELHLDHTLSFNFGMDAVWHMAKCRTVQVQVRMCSQIAWRLMPLRVSHQEQQLLGRLDCYEKILVAEIWVLHQPKKVWIDKIQGDCMQTLKILPALQVYNM